MTKLILTILTILIAFYSNSQEEIISKQTIDSIENHTQLSHFSFISSIKVDYLPTDFSEFKDVLSEYNIDVMNKISPAMNFEMGGAFKKTYIGYNFGYKFVKNTEYNSIYIDFNYTQHGMHFGYNLVNSKRFLIQPKANISWNRYRLINTDKERKIPLEQYITNKDLDIRFNQVTTFTGLNIAYKMYSHDIHFFDYWTIGIYGGYLHKLNDKPFIYSKGNRLESDKKIRVDNYNVGLYFSVNIN